MLDNCYAALFSGKANRVDSGDQNVVHVDSLHIQHQLSGGDAGDIKKVADELANALAFFGVAGFDGAFVGMQSGDGRAMSQYMAQLTDAMVALGEAQACVRC